MSFYKKYLTLLESGYPNITKIVKPFVNRENGKVPEAEIYFHQDLDGVASALAMREYLEEYGIKTVDSHIVQYGGREFYVKAPSLNKLHVMVDFGHEKSEFHIWTDHHIHDFQQEIEDVKKKYKDDPERLKKELAKIDKGSGDIKHAKSNAEIINGYFSTNRGFSAEDLKIISMVDSAGFAKDNIGPEEVAKTVFELDREKDTAENGRKMRLAAAEALLAFKNKKTYLTGIVSGKNGTKYKVSPSLLSIYNYTKQWIIENNIMMRKKYKEEYENIKNETFKKQDEIVDLENLELYFPDFNLHDVDKEKYEKIYNTTDYFALYLRLAIKYKLTNSDKDKIKFLIDKLKASGEDPSTFERKRYKKMVPVFDENQLKIVNKLKEKFSNIFLSEGSAVFDDKDAYKLSELIKKLLKPMEYNAYHEKLNQDIAKADLLRKIKLRYLQKSLNDIEKNKMDYSFEIMFSSNIVQKENVVFLKGLAEMQGNKSAVTFGGYNRYAMFRTYRNSSYAITEWGMGLLQISCNPWKDKENPINLYELTSMAIENVANDLLEAKITLGTLKRRKEKNPKDKMGLDKIIGFSSMDIKKILEDGYVFDKNDKFVKNNKIKEQIKKALDSNRYTALTEEEKRLLSKYYIDGYHWVKYNSGGHVNIANIAGLDIVEEYVPMEVPDVPNPPKKGFVPSYELIERQNAEETYKNLWTAEQKRADLAYQKRREQMKNKDPKTFADNEKTLDMIRNINDYYYEPKKIIEWLGDNINELYGKDKLFQHIITKGNMLESKSIHPEWFDGNPHVTKLTDLSRFLEEAQAKGEDTNNYRILVIGKNVVKPSDMKIYTWQSRLQFGRGKMEAFDTINNVMIRKYATGSYSYRSTDIKRNITEKIKSFLFESVKNTDLVSNEKKVENIQKMIDDKASYLVMIQERIRELEKEVALEREEFSDIDSLPRNIDDEGIVLNSKKLEDFKKIFSKQIISLHEQVKENEIEKSLNGDDNLTLLLKTIKKDDPELVDIIFDLKTPNDVE